MNRLGCHEVKATLAFSILIYTRIKLETGKKFLNILWYRKLRDVTKRTEGILCTVRDGITVPGNIFFLFLNIFLKLQLECSYTTKMSICYKFHENRTESKVVGTNGLTLAPFTVVSAYL